MSPSFCSGAFAFPGSGGDVAQEAAKRDAAPRTERVYFFKPLSIIDKILSLSCVLSRYKISLSYMVIFAIPEN
jgi:hypothetical protein